MYVRKIPFSALTLLASFSFFRSSSSHPSHLKVQTIYQFDKPTWIENIAVRSNGDLIVTLLDRPEVHLISPSANPPTATLVHSFAGTAITGTLGIAEIDHDVFAFVAGTIQRGATPGAYGVWKADFRKSPAAVSKITDVPGGELLNGLVELNDHAVLIADSMAGNILLLDTETGKSEVVIDDASMKPGTEPFVSGINGVKILHSHLYYTNSFTGKLQRVKIDCETGKAIGRFETIAEDLHDSDDFAIRDDGTVYAVRDSYNLIEKVFPNGKHEPIAGAQNLTDIPGPTSAALGRTERDKDVVYVVGNGGLKAPINGSVVVNGSVVAVRI